MNDARRQLTGSLTLAILLGFSAVLSAAPPTTQPASAPTTLQGKIARRLEQFEKQHKATVGFFAIDLKANKTPLAYQADKLMIPASNMKLYASSFALLKLGDRFKFTTSLHRNGNDLVLTGAFDPLLGDPVIAKRARMSIYTFLDRLAKAGRKSFGNTQPNALVVCTSFQEPKHFYPPTWADRHKINSYAPPVADMNFHDNCFDVTFHDVEGQIKPKYAPYSRFIQFINAARPGKKQQWRLTYGANMEQVRLLGTLAAASSSPVSTPIPNPPVFLAKIFLERLFRVKGAIPKMLRRETPTSYDLSKAKLLEEVQTPIHLVLRRANQDSLNLAAECMMLRAGDGTWAGSAAAMHKTLTAAFGLNDKLVMVDGSGLSRKNQVTAQATAKMLSGILKKKEGKALIKSMAVCGKSGTLKNRIKPLTGRVIAKTGFLSGVDALSGYLQDKQGRPLYAFSLLINDIPSRAPAKQLQEEIMLLLAETNAKAP